jgi:hypothetical protein
MEVSQNGWFIMENHGKSHVNDFKWMIWEYPYFRTPPYMDPSLIHCSSSGWEKVAIPLLTYDSDL